MSFAIHVLGLGHAVECTRTSTQVESTSILTIPKCQHDEFSLRSPGHDLAILLQHACHVSWSVFDLSKQPQNNLENEEKAQECHKAAKYMKQLLELDIKPKFVC
jgi:hypothetical protein